MNKYRNGFTPEEVALIAVGLSQHQEIPYMRQQQAPQGGFTPAHINDTQNTINEENKKIKQAREIMEALIDETYLSYKFERNESGAEPVLEIYKHDFYNQDEEYIYPEKTQLTKASLAKWFEEAGEINISKIFKEPEKIVPINHFKQAFTAEHSALIAVGLQYYSSIESALEGRQYQEDELFHAKRIIEQGGEYTDLEVDPKLEGDSIYNATNIKEALLEEIKIGYQNLNFNLVAADFAGIGMNPNAISPSRGTEIVIDCEKYENKDNIKYEETLITKHSVAIWLWNHGYKKYAINVQGNIEEIIQENSNKKNDLAKLINNTSVAIEDGHSAGTELNKKNTPIPRTPESSLLDSLGVMAWLLSKKTNKFQRSDKPNASQIKENVVTVINDLGLNENTDNKIMFSNLNKDISTALKQLEGRFKV
jgi:hypothetical protein